MADADSTAHIRTLLTTLFFKYMRPLIEAGRVYTAVPPSAQVRTDKSAQGTAEVRVHIQRGRVPEEAHGTHKKGIGFKEPQRYKGLGRWTPTSSRRPRWTEAQDAPTHNGEEGVTEQAIATFERLMVTMWLPGRRSSSRAPTRLKPRESTPKKPVWT